jgi:hypothetical protein
MPTRKRVKPVRKVVDVLVIDREDRPILIGEVKSKAGSESTALSQIRDFLNFTDLAVPFVMIVDPDRIRIFHGDDGLENRPVFSAETRPILGHYSDYYRESKDRGIGEDFLRDLVLSWLRDLSYRWRSKSAPPPAFEELDRLGLIRLLKGAIFESEVPFGGYRLY